MTTQPSDEDILIQAARAERGQHRSGASMAGMLAVAALFGGAGAPPIFLPPLIALVPPPCSVSAAIMITLGVVAFAIAGFFVLAALASSPLASWGSPVPGVCPTCGQPRLRSDSVPGPSGGTLRGGLRGVVTLCETRDCDYASA